MLAGLLVAAALLLVFVGTISRSTDVESKAELIRADVEALEERVREGEAEIDFVQSEAFVRQQARALGLGLRGETRFRLPEDAPPAEPIAPIGSAADDDRGGAPFDAWMELLFGS